MGHSPQNSLSLDINGGVGAITIEPIHILPEIPININETLYLGPLVVPPINIPAISLGIGIPNLSIGPIKINPITLWPAQNFEQAITLSWPVSSITIPQIRQVSLSPSVPDTLIGPIHINTGFSIPVTFSYSTPALTIFPNGVSIPDTPLSLTLGVTAGTDAFTIPDFRFPSNHFRCDQRDWPHRRPEHSGNHYSQHPLKPARHRSAGPVGRPRASGASSRGRAVDRAFGPADHYARMDRDRGGPQPAAAEGAGDAGRRPAQWHVWRVELEQAVKRQSGRRGIVIVRELLPLASHWPSRRWRARPGWSCMTAGCPAAAAVPDRRPARADLAARLRLARTRASRPSTTAWTGTGGPDAFLRDRRRTSALQELGWLVHPIIAEDVRYRPVELIRRLETSLRRAA